MWLWATSNCSCSSPDRSSTSTDVWSSSQLIPATSFRPPGIPSSTTNAAGGCRAAGLFWRPAVGWKWTGSAENCRGKSWRRDMKAASGVGYWKVRRSKENQWSIMRWLRSSFINCEGKQSSAPVVRLQQAGRSWSVIIQQVQHRDLPCLQAAAAASCCCTAKLKGSAAPNCVKVSHFYRIIFTFDEIIFRS